MVIRQITYLQMAVRARLAGIRYGNTRYVFYMGHVSFKKIQLNWTRGSCCSLDRRELARLPRYDCSLVRWV